MKNQSVILPVTLNLLGSIIGAGVFGLPAVFARMGILGGTMVFFAILTVVLFLNMLYLKIIYWVGGSHRMPGYIGAVLGRPAKIAAIISMAGKIAGTSLAYIILGGIFLTMLSRDLGWSYPTWAWTMIFWGFGAIVVFYGAKFVKEVESNLTWMLIGFILFSVVILFPFFDWPSMSAIKIDGLFGSLGIIFFSTTAMTVLPDIVEIAGKKQKDAHIGVVLAILLAGVLSWLFGIAIASVYPHVKNVQDIQLAFPTIFWWLIPLVGLLAVSTSFITFIQALKNLIHVDLGLQVIPSWIVAIVTPVLLFVLVSQDFMKTIGFVGGVLTTFNGLLVCVAAYTILRRPGKRTVSVLKMMGVSPRVQMMLLRVWKFVPIPIALMLILVIAEHILTLFL